MQPKGSYLSWDQMIWKYYGSPKDIKVSEQEICNDSEKVSIAVPAKVNFDEAKLGCQNLGNGRIHVPNTREEFSFFHLWYLDHFGSLSESYCKDLWTPITDRILEDTFVNIYDGSTLEYFPNKKGQPNGGRSQNCLNMMMAYHPTPYTDEDCSNQYCYVCQEQGGDV